MIYRLRARSYSEAAKSVGHQTAVYAGGELLCGEVDEREKANELNTGIWCCKTATFSDALY